MAVMKEEGQDLSKDPRFEKFKREWELQEDPRYLKFKKQWENTKPSFGETVKDVGKQAVVGGATGLLGLPGDVLQLVSMIPGMGWVRNANTYVPTTEQWADKIEEHTGWDLQPKTKAGRIARSGGEVAGSLIVPGGVAARGAKTVGGLAKAVGKTAARGATGGALGQVVGEATNSELAQAGTTLLTSGRVPGRVLSKVSKGAIKTLQTGKIPPKAPKGYESVKGLLRTSEDKGAFRAAVESGITAEEANPIFRSNKERAVFNATASGKQRKTIIEGYQNASGKFNNYVEKVGKEMQQRGPIPDHYAPKISQRIDHAEKQINKLNLPREIKGKLVGELKGMKGDFVETRPVTTRNGKVVRRKGGNKEVVFTDKGKNPGEVLKRQVAFNENFQPKTAEQEKAFRIINKAFDGAYDTYGKGAMGQARDIVSLQRKLSEAANIGSKNPFARFLDRSMTYTTAASVVTGKFGYLITHYLLKKGLTRPIAHLAMNSPKGQALMKSAAKALKEGDKAKFATIVQSLERLAKEKEKEHDQKK